jgi:hypothetical protein
LFPPKKKNSKELQPVLNVRHIFGRIGKRKKKSLKTQIERVCR